MNDELKMSLKSMNISDDKKEQLKQLFPEVFTENKVDFERLKQVLGDNIDAGRERYGINWAGKNNCFKIIQEPSVGTLKPCKEESVDFDETENVFIEGDNLEVLKLLQKSYYGKVKMIYIDPPYNTGNEFIYPDNFSETLDTYLKYTDQTDTEGKKFSTNMETDGRFHSKWMNMMYPRLYLARNLLKNDGVVFISIDEHEVTNLQKICNEIFGEDNYLSCITVVSNLKGRSDDRYFATAHNYLLAYQKGAFKQLGVPLPEEYWDDYPEKNSDGKRFRLQGLRKRGSGAKREDRPNMYFPIYVDPNSKNVSLEKNKVFTEEVIPKLSDSSDGRWRWGKDTVARNLEYLSGGQVGPEKRWDVFEIDYAEAESGLKRIKPKTVWLGSHFANEAGTLELKKILGKQVFQNPKPTGLINYCLEQVTEESDIVLDFFAGSCTTAQAVIEHNVETKKNLSFILVQLPETLESSNADQKNAYDFCNSINKKTNIAEIGKERVRRVVEVNKKSMADKVLGFKVLKLSPSNFKIWETGHDQNVAGSLKMFADHIDHNATSEDILYEILLKSGFELTTKIEKVKLEGKDVFSIEEGAMYIFLGEGITKELTYAIAEKAPSRFVCLDHSFHYNDQLKTNTVQLMKSRSIEFRTV